MSRITCCATRRSGFCGFREPLTAVFTTKRLPMSNRFVFLLGITLWQDTGFLGHNPENITVKMPTKKPKGKELTREQKRENKEISSFRILVEHAIGGVKRCRIVKERLRCTKFGFEDKVMIIACGLHNFRIALKNNVIII